MIEPGPIFGRILPSPTRLLAVMLAVIFAVEVGVMLALPHVLPTTFDETTRALLDALLLTLVSAPVLWWLLVGPLRRIAVREQMRADTIVAHAGDGILSVRADGRIVSLNRAAAALFGVDPPDVVGRAVGTLLPGLDLGGRAAAGGPPIEAEGRRGEGTRFPVAVSVATLPGGGGVVAIVRDLTDLRRAESERITAARAREALRSQQMSMLAQLATGVAHEIRNPLTSIKMLIQVNRAEFERAGLPTRDLDLVEQEIRRMERSVTALLDYGRPSRPDSRPTALQAVVERTVRLIEGRARAAGVTLVLDLPPGPVEAQLDVGEMQGLLVNLSLNAIEAMPGGGRLTIAVAGRGPEAVLTVTDTGPGLAAEVIERLFAPFVTTKPDGIGLGLGICRRIAEGHGGRLTGENGPDGGARFTLTLPRLDVSTHPSGEGRDAEAAAHR